jgi:Reverse transcriptase (RNA-dependent DNA polymerase)
MASTTPAAAVRGKSTYAPKERGIRESRHHSKWPKVADAVIEADDCIVFCNGTKAQALEMKEELKNVLAHMGLTLSEEKTKVTHITEGVNFLG